jgi:hypothetical protein
MPGIRIAFFVLLSGVGTPACGQGLLRAGLNGEVGVSQLLLAGSNQYVDNIIDRQRGDGTLAWAAIMLGDTTGYPGFGRWAVGLGAGAMRWEGFTMLPVFGQFHWYPVLRDRRVLGLRLPRLGFVARYGALIGAWQPTSRGQLQGHSFADLNVRYPFVVRRMHVAVNAGFGILLMRGPYTRAVDGVPEDLRSAEFVHPQVGLSVGF